MVPSNEPFDLALFNSYTEKIIRYSQSSYWDFFAVPDAADVIERNLDRMWQALHGDVDDWMRMILCAPDAMRNFLLSADQVQLKEAVIRNIQDRSDATIPEECLEIKVPIRFICCTEDAVCKPELMNAAKQQGVVPHLEEITIESAHWSPMENPEEIASNIRNLLVNVSLNQSGSHRS